MLATLHQQQPSIAVGIVGNDLVVADTPMHKVSATMTELIRKLKDNKVERIAFERGVTQDELVTLMQNLSRLGGKAGDARQGSLDAAHPRRPAEERRRQEAGRHRQRHRRDPADVLERRAPRPKSLVESAETEGMPDAPAALQTVDGLADAVTQNRTALMALTAMRNYDNYTFTHMVNVSILTMAQARALGIDGKLLREFGMSALMHDIGKVRTPKEILNKPGKLTDDEFVIMRRHVVDGAEILRRTPEMPILAPVVAFEHHLRLDGSGYPFTVKRESMNLGSMLCAIADVYDAMRSQRSYQQALSDRSHPRRAEAQRRSAARSEPGPPLRRSCSASIRRATWCAQHRRGRGRAARSRARSAPAARARAVRRRRQRGSTCRSSAICGSRSAIAATTARSQTVVSPVDPADYNIDPLDVPRELPRERSAAHRPHRLRRAGRRLHLAVGPDRDAFRPRRRSGWSTSCAWRRWRRCC